MAGIRQPYQIVLAGKHFVGKTTVYETLKSCFEESHREKFKCVKSTKGASSDFCLHQYLDSPRKIKLQLWDTGNMEKEGGVRTMTRNYFRQAIAVILVYDTRDLESLWDLREWVKVVEESSDFKQHVIYTLWGNEKEEMCSSVNNPVEMCHLQDLQKSLPKKVEDQLVCRMDGSDQDSVMQCYETLVRTLDNNMKMIERQLMEASQRSRAFSDNEERDPNPNIRVGEGEGEQPQVEKGCFLSKC